MGSCFSTCRPKKKHFKEEERNRVNFLQDKLVISQSQAPKTPQPRNNKISPSPPSPTSSTSSISSFTCTTSNNSTTTISSYSSLSSSASSVLSSKDRSFSNEFLLSCIKENPHIVRINSIKECSLSLSAATNKADSQKFDLVSKPFVASQRVIGMTTPQKRVRSSSPSTLPRQKSFRKEPERLNSFASYSSHSLPNRSILRSPSPSRRFDGGNNYNRVSFTNSLPKEICPKGLVGSKLSTVNSSVSYSSSLRRENLRPMMSNSDRVRSCLMNKKTNINRVSSKIDEAAVAQAMSHYDGESIPFEDIDNPLISLDCFIFI